MWYIQGILLISWKSKKQSSFSKSSTEAEYRALVHTIAVAWIRLILKDLHEYLHSPLMHYCDNQYAIALSLNLVQHSRIKHLEIDFHFVHGGFKKKTYQFSTYTPRIKQQMYQPRDYMDMIFLDSASILNQDIPLKIERGYWISMQVTCHGTCQQCHPYNSSLLSKSM